MAVGSTVFVRDRFTWLAYVMLAYFAYLQASLGPVMPFLRDELGLSYTVGGLHFSALALGMVLAGLSADRAVRRWGRRAVFWAGGAGMAVGALAVALGPHPALTVGGSWIMGYLGTFVLALVQSSLADRHGPRRAVALTEANVGASFVTALCPLLVGGFQRAGIGWQAALILAAGVWVASAIAFRGQPFPAQEQPAPVPGERRPALPLTFWVYWVALVLCVAAEWSIVSWGADFLVNPGGLGKSDASMVMAFFFGAMVTGRAFGSRLSRAVDSARLLLAAIGVALAGFMLFWLAPVAGLTIAGLFVAGLGVSNLFPFLMAIAVGVGAAHSDAASARVTLGAGLAILVAPQTLGWVADQVDLRSAYSIVLALLVMAAAVTALANRRVARHNGVPSTSSAGR